MNYTVVRPLRHITEVFPLIILKEITLGKEGLTYKYDLRIRVNPYRIHIVLGYGESKL